MNFINQLYKYTDNTRWGLETSKANALEFYKCAKELYLACPVHSNFENYCEAKKYVCF